MKSVLYRFRNGYGPSMRHRYTNPAPFVVPRVSRILRACLKLSWLEHAFEAHAGHEHRGEHGHRSRGVEARLVVDAQPPAALEAPAGPPHPPPPGVGPEPS